MNKLNTIEIINSDKEPIILKKEGKFIAVAIDIMSDKYVVTFDIINEENVHNFDIEKHEYETIGIIECQNQDSGFLDARNYCIEKLDNMPIETFKGEYF